MQSEVEKHRTDMDRKVMEVISLKKAHQEQEAELKYEIDRLKEQLKKAKEECAKEQQRSKKVGMYETTTTIHAILIIKIYIFVNNKTIYSIL